MKLQFLQFAKQTIELNGMMTVLCSKLNHRMAIVLLVSCIFLSHSLCADTVTGTAFFVTSDGYALTCAHVVKDASKIELVIGQKTVNAAIITIDEKNDVALLKAEVTNQVTIPISNTGAIASGAKAWVLGFPLASVLGESLKVTSGTVSGIVVQGTQRIIQFDAAVNPGNSGSPLLNERGVVVGIVNAKIVGSDASGVGFAIPTNYAMKLLRDQDISFPNTPVGTAMDGPTLTKKANPAIALVRATVPLKEPKLIKSLPTGECSSISFARDGKTVVCVGRNSNKATIWDIAKGNVVQSFVGITRNDFRPEVPLETLEPMLAKQRIQCATFSPGGRFVVGAGIRFLMFWDIETGARVGTFVAGVVTIYSYSGDGNWFLYGKDFTGRDIHCKNTETNEESQLNTGECAGISISPSGNLVAICYGTVSDSSHVKGTIEIKEIAKGNLVGKIIANRACVEAIDYSPDGRFIAGCERDIRSDYLTINDDWDIPQGVITIWNSETGSAVKIIECPRMSPQFLQYSPDGKILAVEVTDAKKDLDKKKTVSSVWLYNTSTYERIASLPGALRYDGAGDFQAFSPDSNFIAICGADQTAQIWQIR